MAAAGNLSILLCIWLWLGLTAIRDLVDPSTAKLLLPGAIVLTVSWSAFVGWRAWRLILVFAERSDSQYDREGKFALPPEYADSDSATETKRRRASKKAR